MKSNISEKIPSKATFDTDLRTHRRFGLLVFVMLFGFGGVWSATAPIQGAAVSSGKVTSRSYSKVVQHLEGGSLISMSRMGLALL